MTLCASQTYELLDAMEKDSGVKLDSLCVDGGVTKADTLLNIMAGVHTSLYFWFYFFSKLTVMAKQRSIFQSFLLYIEISIGSIGNQKNMLVEFQLVNIPAFTQDFWVFQL